MLIVIGCMNIQEDMHRGERTGDAEIQKESRSSWADAKSLLTEFHKKAGKLQRFSQQEPAAEQGLQLSSGGEGTEPWDTWT